MRRIHCIRSDLTLVAVVLGSCWAATAVRAQPMVGLGTLPGASSSVAYDSSADGSAVVGESGGEAFLWTEATGMVGLGGLPGLPYSIANGVSADGSTVVGISYHVTEQGGEIVLASEAFVWTAGTGMVGLGNLPGTTSSEATDVSADGSTVVGACSVGLAEPLEAFVWTAATGMVGLGTLPGQPTSYATGVSDHGSTIVGRSPGFYGPHEAFVWTAATGMVGLGSLSGALNPSSNAQDVSADGSTIVGSSTNAQGSFEAFVWTAATGMVGLGYLPGAPCPYSHASAASADGSTIVGASASAQSSLEAFFWTPATGMVGLGRLPGALNPESAAHNVSADGSTVVGQSVNAQGNFEAFVLRLQPAPALILALIEQVKGLNLKYGIQNGLDTKLDAALRALDGVNEHNIVAAVNALEAFISAVEAQSGKTIPTAAADELIAAATVIINQLQ